MLIILLYQVYKILDTVFIRRRRLTWSRCAGPSIIIEILIANTGLSESVAATLWYRATRSTSFKVTETGLVGSVTRDRCKSRY